VAGFCSASVPASTVVVAAARFLTAVGVEVFDFLGASLGASAGTSVGAVGSVVPDVPVLVCAVTTPGAAVVGVESVAGCVVGDASGSGADGASGDGELGLAAVSVEVDVVDDVEESVDGPVSSAEATP